MSKYLGAAFLADVRGVLLTGLSTATNAAITATDSVLIGMGKLQAQLTALLSTGTVTATGATTARTLPAHFGDYHNVKDFGAVGDGVTNDTAAINTALSTVGVGGTLYFPAGTYMLAEASVGIGYALTNPGVSIIGQRGKTIFAPLASMVNTADFMVIKPASGAEIDFLEMRDFYVYPGLAGTMRGKRCLYFDFTASCNVTRLLVTGIYCTPGLALSLEMANTVATNPQGCPSNTVIERNQFMEGIKLGFIGDSVSIRNNTIRSVALSGRSGIDLSVVNGSGGQASHPVIEQNNIDASGGAIVLRNGRNAKVLHNNIEQDIDAGTSNSSVVDLSGATNALIWPEVRGNHISIFGTSTAVHAITASATNGAVIDGNTILAGFAISNSAIVIGASSSDAVVGYNEISANFTTSVDASLSTRCRNYRYAITPGNGFAAVGSGACTPAWWLDRDGIVHLEGLLSCPASPFGITIATLPASVRPMIGYQSWALYGLVSGTPAMTAITIDTAGAMVYVGVSSSTQVSLNGISFTTQAHVPGNL